MDESRSNYGLVRLWHPAGVEVSLPTPAEPKAALDFISAAIEAGLMTHSPGAPDANTEVFVITDVARRSKDDDGTPMLDLYAEHPRMTYKVFTLYVNNDADAAEWEAVTGLALSAIPLVEGRHSLERGDRMWATYGRALPKPATVNLKRNPAYNPDEPDIKKRKPQFKWGGFAGRPAPSAGQKDSGGGEKPQGATAGQYTCHRIDTKRARNGSMCHNLVGDNGEKAFTFTRDSLTVLTNLHPTMHADLEREGTITLGGEYFGFPIRVYWKANGEYPQVERVEVIETAADPVDDIPF